MDSADIKVSCSQDHRDSASQGVAKLGSGTQLHLELAGALVKSGQRVVWTILLLICGGLDASSDSILLDRDNLLAFSRNHGATLSVGRASVGLSDAIAQDHHHLSEHSCARSDALAAAAHVGSRSSCRVALLTVEQVRHHCRLGLRCSSLSGCGVIANARLTATFPFLLDLASRQTKQ